MLRIRPKQFEVFQPVAEAAFVRRVAQHLRAKHANVIVELPNGTSSIAQLPDGALHEMVGNGIARARGYDMSWESTLTAFVAIMFVAAPNFDEHPLIQRVLRDETVPPDSRIDQLWDRTSDQNWEAVERNYDPSAWGISATPQKRGDAEMSGQ